MPCPYISRLLRRPLRLYLLSFVRRNPFLRSLRLNPFYPLLNSPRRDGEKNFVIFVSFVVNRFWLRLCRAVISVVKIFFVNFSPWGIPRPR
jgi:hypothetical protein